MCTHTEGHSVPNPPLIWYTQSSWNYVANSWNACRTFAANDSPTKMFAGREDCALCDCVSANIFTFVRLSFSPFPFLLLYCNHPFNISALSAISVRTEAVAVSEASIIWQTTALLYDCNALYYAKSDDRLPFCLLCMCNCAFIKYKKKTSDWKERKME